MRSSLLFFAVSFALCGAVQAAGTFTALQTPSIRLSKVSANGAFAVGSNSGSAGFRWTAATGAEDLLPELNIASGINNAGTIAGAVPENGGSQNGGRDLGAYAPVGVLPVQLTDTLSTNSSGYDISDDGTVVGLSYNDGFVGPALAFAWTASDGMSVLPVQRPENYSRANAISADGHVIVGWNDQDDGRRTAVIWQDRVPLDVVDADGLVVGEAAAVTSDGSFVVGSSYTNLAGDGGAWRWSASTGVELIAGMSFAFGVSGDGRTVVGNTGFFDVPPRAAMIWRQGVGTMLLADFLAEQDISVPPDWDLSGGLTGISADGSLLGGWGFGPLGAQSYIIRLEIDADVIFADGFDAAN